MQKVIFTVLTLAATVASAQTSDFGHWRVQQKQGFVEGFTNNDSGALFGMLCGAKCVHYVDMRLRCEEGAKYFALVSSESGSFPVTLSCTQYGKRYVSIIEDIEMMPKVLATGKSIGFAIATSSGEFNVSRFSLNGANKAISKALEIAIENNETSGLTGYKNERL